MAIVSLAMMVPAERVPPVITIAAIAGVGEEHVLVLVITNQVGAAFRLRQFAGLAAQPAASFRGRVL